MKTERRDPTDETIRTLVEKARRRTDGLSTLEFAEDCVRLGFRAGCRPPVASSARGAERAGSVATVEDVKRWEAAGLCRFCGKDELCWEGLCGDCARAHPKGTYSETARRSLEAQITAAQPTPGEREAGRPSLQTRTAEPESRGPLAEAGKPAVRETGETSGGSGGGSGAAFVPSKPEPATSGVDTLARPSASPAAVSQEEWLRSRGWVPGGNAWRLMIGRRVRIYSFDEACKFQRRSDKAKGRASATPAPGDMVRREDVVRGDVIRWLRHVGLGDRVDSFERNFPSSTSLGAGKEGT